MRACSREFARASERRPKASAASGWWRSTTGTLGSVVGEPPAAVGKGFTVRATWAHADAARLGELALAVARGELIVPIAKRLPLAQGAEAQRLAEQGGLGGKVLLLM